jgi:hypothetical protein
MRTFTAIVALVGLVAVALMATPAAAEVEKAVIAILGGMQCSL